MNKRAIVIGRLKYSKIRNSYEREFNKAEPTDEVKHKLVIQFKRTDSVHDERRISRLHQSKDDMLRLVG